MGNEVLFNENDENTRMFNNIANQFIKRNLRGEVNSLDDIMKELEKLIITKALFVFNGNQKKVASLLKIKYTTLHEKVKRSNIGFEKQTVFENFLN